MRALVVLLLALPTALAAATTHAEWEGRTATVVCPLVPPLVAHPGCAFLEQPSGTWTELPLGATRVAGTLTWTPRTPAFEEMRVFVFGLRDDGMPISGVETRAASPLAWDVDLARLAGERHAVSIHGEWQEVRLSTAGALVELGQPFRVAMDVTTEP